MRAVVVVLDSLGVGALPDAAAWGDAGSDTLGHLAAAAGPLDLPHLASLGLGNVHPVPGVAPAERPEASWGLAALASAGKDSVTGHWEMMGHVVTKPFGRFPEGFPRAILDPFEAIVGLPVLGNRAASGTEIIVELGEAHLGTGRPIVYTSADSVFQVAAHERVIPLERLYALCEAAFRICTPFRVARVIARPFDGPPGAFARTGNRRDFALQPDGETVLDRILAAGLEVVGVGKVPSLFGGRGFSRSHKADGNEAVVERLLDVLADPTDGLVFANLVDFDTKYGHRRDPEGYARALEAFDRSLPALFARLHPEDLLVITADHGNDPTHPGSDHTREYVPFLAWRSDRPARPLGRRGTLADVGATVAAYLGVPWHGPGRDAFAGAGGRAA
ncbi:MAG: phosphopentomutase [Deltaproteobacteria bacterium]|nr:phosphopentomutase [Deltaproteobacteria bacterium]